MMLLIDKRTRCLYLQLACCLFAGANASGLRARGATVAEISESLESRRNWRKGLVIVSWSEQPADEVTRNAEAGPQSSLRLTSTRGID